MMAGTGVLHSVWQLARVAVDGMLLSWGDGLSGGARVACAAPASPGALLVGFSARVAY
jgi:hypothetical protein